MHLLQGAVAKGANLQTHTPVTHLSEAPLPDGRWEATTPRGPVRARKVLLATNAYTAGVAPGFAGHIVPVRGICSHIVPGAGRRAPFLPYSYGIRQGTAKYDYLISRPDGSIIVGGARSQFWDDPSRWYNVVDDSALIEPAVPYFDDLMQKTFLGWEDSGAHVNKIWTGSEYPLLFRPPARPKQMR